MFLNSEEKDCPDKSTVKVQFAYYGAENKDGIGGSAAVDKIFINFLDEDADLVKANAKLAAQKLISNKFKKVLDDAKAEDKKAQDKVTALKKQLEDWLTKEIAKTTRRAKSAVTSAQKWVATKERNLADVKLKLQSTKITRLRSDIAKLKVKLAKEEAKSRPSTSVIKRYKTSIANKNKSLQKEIDKVNVKITKAQNELDKANADLKKVEDILKDLENTARAKALKKPYAINLNAKIDEAEAAQVKTAKIVADAQKDFDAEIAKEDKIQAEIDKLTQIINLWATILPGLIVHEEGHRRICYFYVDELTDLLNSLRAWGYAPTLVKAKDLGKKHYAKVRSAKITAILTAAAAKQVQYDHLTDHGLKQNLWNWGQQLP